MRYPKNIPAWLEMVLFGLFLVGVAGWLVKGCRSPDPGVILVNCSPIVRLRFCHVSENPAQITGKQGLL